MSYFTESLKRSLTPSAKTNNATFGPHALRLGWVFAGGRRYDATECTAYISETGTAEDINTSGAGGAIAGAMIAGPIGALALGGGTHVSRNTGWFVLNTPDKIYQVPLHGRNPGKFAKARRFVMNLEAERNRQFHKR